MWSNAGQRGIQMAYAHTDHSPVASARNLLVREAMSINPDYILFVDADILYPANALLRLIAHEKDAIGSFYVARNPPYSPMGKLLDPTDPLPTGGLHRATQFGMGFSLFKASVFREVQAPWFYHQWNVGWAKDEKNPDGEISEDITFCRSLAKYGIEMWTDLDLSYELGHIGQTIITVPRPTGLQAAAE